MAAFMETAPKKHRRIVDVYKCHPSRNDILTNDDYCTAYINIAKKLIMMVMSALTETALKKQLP